MDDPKISQLQPPIRMTPNVLKRAGLTILGWIEFPLRFIFGRDVFISYSRSDSRKYAPNLALELQRRMPKLSFYLDRWIAPPSGHLPLSLKLQLRWSSIMVVICTENAIGSNFVKDEVARFASLGRKALTVDVAGAFNAVRAQEPWVGFSGADPEAECIEAIESGDPSDNVIQRILKMVEFTTQARRLRQAVWGTLVLVLLSIGGTVAISRSIISDAKEQAAEAEQKATRAQGIADQAEKRANAATRLQADAEKAQSVAEAKALEAGEKAVAADELRKTAEAKADEALVKERNARAEAAKQQTLATAGRLAAENVLVPEPILEHVEKKVLYTIESLRLATTRTAYRNLMEGLRIIPPVLDTATQDGAVKDLLFTPDGKYLVIVANNGLWLRNAATLSSAGKLGPAQKISGAEPIRLAEISRNGKYLAAASNDKVRLWRIDTMAELPAIDQKNVSSIAFTEDGEVIAIGSRFIHESESMQKTATVWRLGEKYTELASLTAPVGVLDVSFSRDKLKFCTLTEDGLHIWDTNGGPQSLPSNTISQDTLQSGGFSPNGKYLFVTGFDDRRHGGVQRADTRQNVFMNQLDFLEFSPDGRFLVTTSSDDETQYRQVHIWDASTENFNELSQIDYRSLITNGKFSRDGKLLALVSLESKTAEIWDTLSGRLLTSVRLKNNRGTLAFSPDGKFFAATAGAEITVWPLGGELKTGEITNAEGPTAVSADGRLITVANGARVKVLNSSNGSEVSSIETHCEVGSLAFDWQSQRIATAGRDCGMSVWHLLDPKLSIEILPKHAISHQINGLTFSRDGREIAVATDNGVSIYNVAYPSRSVRIGTGEAFSVALSLDGQQIATTDFNGVNIWNRNRPNDKPRRIEPRMTNGDSNALFVAFNDDGRLVIADDYLVRIMEINGTSPVQVGDLVLQLGTEPDIKHVLLSPNGAFVAKTGGFANRNITTSVWPLDISTLINTACSRLSTPLSLEDWRNVFGSKQYQETCPGLRP
jgi:WD40 repeat protein